jgi:hypothetical protein
MLEINVNVKAPELAAALEKLAEALGKSTFVSMHGTDNKVIGYTPEVNVTTDKPPVVGQPAAPVAPVNPTPAPVAPVGSAPASAVPTSATAVPTPAPVPVQETAAQTAPVSVAAAAVPVSMTPPTYTLDEISRAGVSLVDAGQIGQLQELLSKFGIQAITQLNPEQYGTFATELRALGAQI